MGHVGGEVVVPCFLWEDWQAVVDTAVLVT